jgi:hypothetical protein
VSDQKNAAPASVPSQKIVTELKVSGNLMTLDSGLFCIFNAPGSTMPDAATGLPGVRVSVPVGPVFRPDAVTITSFRDDGWLAGWNGAALVRVTRGPAQILVTIYQAPNTTAEPPRLQILRLAEAASLPPLGGGRPGAAPPAPPPAAAVQAIGAPPPGGLPGALPGAGPAQAALPTHVAGGGAGAAIAAPQDTPASGQAGEAAKSGEIVAHIQGRGDVMSSLDDWMGEPGSKRWVEGFAVSPKGRVGPGDVEYQAVLGRGWLSPWAEGGQYCGSRGMSLPILGLRMRLRGDAAERFDCSVQASFVDGTEIGPLDNGEPCQADSMAPLEAFKIILTERGSEAAAPKAAPVAEKQKPSAAPRRDASPPAQKPKAKPSPAKPSPLKPPTRKRLGEA